MTWSSGVGLTLGGLIIWSTPLRPPSTKAQPPPSTSTPSTTPLHHALLPTQTKPTQPNTPQQEHPLSQSSLHPPRPDQTRPDQTRGRPHPSIRTSALPDPQTREPDPERGVVDAGMERREKGSCVCVCGEEEYEYPPPAFDPIHPLTPNASKNNPADDDSPTLMPSPFETGAAKEKFVWWLIWT
ncbi:hypothetical protein HO173_006264 [Letharia columbiana]|uniref:Uncharacterized protein n=1 Tax=Letharia columbiana TaxID=112416 RepID=A0A8H6L4U9_9LECA|nr:uncharacterized protein HO173_006264 [Letharia columbiana]KAF6235581.1 hypothetical protein HO173_006264 [Letharia columbiana]